MSHVVSGLSLEEIAKLQGLLGLAPQRAAQLRQLLAAVAALGGLQALVGQAFGLEEKLLGRCRVELLGKPSGKDLTWGLKEARSI